jgi:hypothetical protein
MSIATLRSKMSQGLDADVDIDIDEPIAAGLAHACS